MRIQWDASPTLSCLHVASVWQTELGATTDTKLSSCVAVPAGRLRTVLQGCRIAPSDFWNHLIGLSLTSASLPDQIAAAFGHAGDPESRFPDPKIVAENVAELNQAVCECLPNLQHDLELRSRPLREQWEARGPGLLHTLGQQLATRPLCDEATVSTVYPICGGNGHVHPDYSLVCIEAVLANPISKLPEVLRLGWLLAQLDGTRTDTANSGTSSDSERRHIAAMAIIPPLLSAAEHVELSECTKLNTQLALQNWCTARPLSEQQSTQQAETLWRWWQSCRRSRPSWSEALLQLETMNKK